VNTPLKQLLQSVGLYYFLQGRYRRLRQGIDRFVTRRRYRPFRGAGFTCNACGVAHTRYRELWPAPENAAALEQYQVVAGYGPNMHCPWCLCHARERLVIARLQQDPPRGQHWLHLSPEPAVHRCLAAYARTISADIEPGLYRTVDPHTVFADLRQLPWADHAFEGVMANHVLEHVPDDRQAMAELYRVLRPGGRAILQVPFSVTIQDTLESPALLPPAEASRRFGQSDHVRIYERDDYVRRLEQTGFTVQVIPFEALLAEQAHALQEGECFFEIRKPG